MYSENNRRSAARRADDEFLRRMMGGDLTGNGVGEQSVPSTDSGQQPLPFHTGESCRPNAHSDNGQSSTLNREKSALCIPSTACPTQLSAPALAMVYAPRQCWRNLFDPAEGLSKGTIFSELELPLEFCGGHCKIRNQEVNRRRPF